MGCAGKDGEWDRVQTSRYKLTHKWDESRDQRKFRPSILKRWSALISGTVSSTSPRKMCGKSWLGAPGGKRTRRLHLCRQRRTTAAAGPRREPFNSFFLICANASFCRLLEGTFPRSARSLVWAGSAIRIKSHTLNQTVCWGRSKIRLARVLVRDV